MAVPIRSSEAPYKVKYMQLTDDMVIKCSIKIVSFKFG